MCGFTVYTGNDKKLKLDVPHDFKSLKHRGPDNSIIRDFGEEGWMGFHRLKIIDISDDGNQPLQYEHIHLVCNGEIYNYRKLLGTLRRSFPFQFRKRLRGDHPALP